MTATLDLRNALRPLELWIRLSVRAHRVLAPTEHGIGDRNLVRLVEAIDLLDREETGIDVEEPPDEFIGDEPLSAVLADDQYPVLASHSERRAIQDGVQQPKQPAPSSKYGLTAHEWLLTEQLAACRRAALGQNDTMVIGTPMQIESAALSEVRRLRAAYEANLRRLYKVQDERDSLARRTPPRVSAEDASAPPTSKWRRVLADSLHEAARRLSAR